jgi:3-hydroxyisobutyrate dehydrogenase-like beta-hydroxyacid dehydrogenase
MTRVTLIGLGEVGTVFAEDLAARGHTDLVAWDTAFTDPGSAASRAAAALPVVTAPAAGAAADGAGLVISAVTAANCHPAAAAAAPGLAPGTWFFDLNSSSPGHKQQAARAVEQAGGRYVEAALMSPIAARRLASPFLLGGPHAAGFAAAAAAWGLSDLTVYSQEVGRAAASKLCRSVITKGLESLLTESLLAARHYGVEKEVLDSLSNILPPADWQEVAAYFISRSLRHGQRRSEEMAEAAATVEEAGVEPLMSLAASERQRRAAGHADALTGAGLAAVIDHIRRSQAAATAGRSSRGTPL